MVRFPKNDIMTLTSEAPRYDLAESIGPDLPLADLLDASADDGLGELALSYGTAQGNPDLRALIAEQHGVSPDDVVVTVGGMHALFLIALILCERGDEVATTTPSFPVARNALDVVGADVRDLSLAFDKGYRLDPDDLSGQLSEKTTLVFLASPQNPSGVSIAHETLRAVLAVMEERCPDAYLLLDETYREAAYGEDPVAPTAVGLNDKVISCASLSKCHGAPGLRLGWAITRDPDLREQLVVGKFSTVISCSAVDEALACRVLQRRDRIIGVRRRRLADGLARTADWVEAHDADVEWVRPDAGALCCLRLRREVFDETAVDRFYDVLAGEGIRIANGLWFGEEARVFRLGFGLLSMEDLDAALAGLSTAVRQTARAAA